MKLFDPTAFPLGAGTPDHDLTRLHRAALDIAAAPSLQAALQTTIHHALEMAHAQHGTLSLGREEDAFGRHAAPWLTVRAGAVPQPQPHPRPHPEHGPEEPGEAPGGDRAPKEDAADRIALTLALHDGATAILRLVAFPGTLFEPRCVELVRLLCELAVVAIEATRRFEQLERAKREWEQIFDGMVDGVYICGSDGVILRANYALAGILGVRIGDILGHRREELYATLPEYQVLRPWQRGEHGPAELDLQTTEFRFGAPERVFTEAMFMLRPGGPTEYGIDNGGAPVAAGRDDEGARRVCIVREITEQRRLQEQLLQSEKLAALGELLSGVAHELNNPLATVVGYSQLLESEAGLPEHTRRQIHMIRHEAERASHIVQNLLTFARRSAPEKMRLSLNEVLRSVVEMRAYQLQSDNITLVTQYHPELPPVWGDSQQLQQVFLNIINNAAQAIVTWRGQGEIRVVTHPAPVHGEIGVRVTISDNGPGIATEHLRRVFDPFFTTKPVGEGTGLGMSISLRIVSNHNGRIWAESRLGHGARFLVELPRAGEEAGLEASLPPPPPDPRPGSRILVVDDEEPVVMLITEILALDGHQVMSAFNGAEALRLLQSQEFDLIISDVRMPAVGGPTFFEILQTTRPDLLSRVIFVTGDTVSQSTQSFLNKAGRPMLPKPFNPERLRALVSDSLRKAGDK